MVYLMKHCQYILTDSGGIQEEAPALGKPVLVLRETTERPEAIAAGCAALVGSDRQKITAMMSDLLNTDGARYRAMSNAKNPFGDGTAAKQITAGIQNYFGLDHGASRNLFDSNESRTDHKFKFELPPNAPINPSNYGSL